MPLTGKLTLALAVAAAIAFPIATAVLWNRLAPGRSWQARTVRWLTRLVLIGLSQVAAVALVGVVVNDSNAFYSSWRQVIGDHHRVAEATAPPGAADTTVSQRLATARLHGHGVVVALSFPGTTSHVGNLHGYVYLPPQYDAPGYTARRFPVVELLAGSPGTPRTWLKSMHVARIVDAQIAAGRASPFILVMPDADVAGARDTECVNVVHGPRVEDYLVHDIRATVLHEFRADPARDDWALMGYSSGGYCATNLAMRNPGMFAAAVSIAGYDRPYLDHQTGELFGHDQALREQNSPIWRALHLTAPPVSLLLMSSRQDPGTSADATALAAAASEPMSVTRVDLRRGGHNFEVWRAEEVVAFGWLSRVLPPPLAPVPTVDGVSPR